MRILVASCRNYADAWNPFVKLLRKFWSKCAWSVELLTDGYPLPEATIFDKTNILGCDDGWCPNLFNYVESIKDTDEHIMLFQEDYWICGKVDHKFIETIYKDMVADQKIGAFRTYPAPAADTFAEGRDWGYISKGRQYRICCAPTIWRTDYLLQFIKGCKTPADFEIQGTKNAEKLPEKVIGVREKHYPLPVLYSAITRGQWELSALNFAADQGIEIEVTRAIKRQ